MKNYPELKVSVTRIRWLGKLSLLGGFVGGLVYLLFPNVQPVESWTANYQDYQSFELYSRLMITPLVLMAAGWVGMLYVLVGNGRKAAQIPLVGTLSTAVGIAAEFVILPALGIVGALTNVYVLVIIGSWFSDIGALIVGVFILRSRIKPLSIFILFLLATPLDVWFIFNLRNPTFLMEIIFALAIGFWLHTDMVANWIRVKHSAESQDRPLVSK
ncbi:MAG: hypothetical protein IT327_19415 [Anaerolineae bacterium]|nr:hypothetical protein [Anaerolineae bacterium]